MKAGAAAAAAAVTALPLLALAMVGVAAATPPPGVAAGGLAPGKVPAAYEQAVLHAGTLCADVSAPLIAAQIQQESGWNPNAVSPAGALGLSQFMPGTWAAHGIDGDADGQADPLNPFDAIASQAAYDCYLAGLVAGLPGDPVDLMLAAYNAGPGAVLAYGGVPPYPETVDYVRRIRAGMLAFAAPVISPSGPRGGIVTAASSMIGVPYSWGGGDGDGPTDGIGRGAGTVGFDCSGLTEFAYAAVGIPIPSTAATQQAAAQPVTDPQPGDLVFFGLPAHHVGIYAGNGMMIDAPHTGAYVRVEPVWSTVTGYGRF